MEDIGGGGGGQTERCSSTGSGGEGRWHPLPHAAEELEPIAAPRRPTEGPPPSAAAGWGCRSRDRRRSAQRNPRKSLEAASSPPSQHRGTAGRRRSAGRSLRSLPLARRGLLPIGPYYCLTMQGAICPPRQLLHASYSTAEPSSCSSSGS